MTRREVWHLVVLASIVVPLFALNGRWGLQGNPDTVSVAVPAWHFAEQGTLDLSGYDVIADNQENLARWYVLDQDGRIVSNRAPGLIALAVPSYSLLGADAFSNAPATAVALLVTAFAVFVSWRVFTLWTEIRFATGAALVLALGTTTWAVSSAELWPHGPDQLWAALAVASVAHGRYATSGLAFAFSITTRPITGLFAAATGLAESWRNRSLKPTLLIASVTALGLAALLVYNHQLFGVWNLRGGYSDFFTSGAAERFQVGDYLLNLFDMFLSPRLGVLVTSPIIGVALFGAIRHRSALQGWMKSLGFAALAYLLVHAALNRASGGAVAFYRYPLEAIVMAGPLLVVGAHRLWHESESARRVVAVTAVVSVLLQFVNVFFLSCVYSDPVVPACLLQ